MRDFVLETIEDIKSTPITQKEFAEAIAQVSFHHKDRLSSLESFGTYLVTDELYGRGYDYYQGLDKEIEALKLQDAQEMAQEYLVNPQVFIFQN